MTCKLEASEKSMRHTLRYTKSIINKMLKKRVYPDDFSLENGIEEVLMEPWRKEIFHNGKRTIRFTYNTYALDSKRKKN